MNRIVPSVVEVLTSKHHLLRPHLGILLSIDKKNCQTVLTNGHLIDHGSANIRLILSSTDQILNEFDSAPVHPAGLSSRTIERYGRIPQVLGAIKELEGHSLKKDYSSALPLGLKKPIYTLDEIILEFQKIKSDKYISSKWATYQTIMHATHLFRIRENALKGMEIECFSKDLIDFYSSLKSKEGEIMEFLTKCMGKGQHSWSDFELKLIQVLKNAVYSSKIYPDINQKFAFDILRKTGTYKPNQSDLIVFLKDSGLVAPWEKFLQRASNLFRVSRVPIDEEEGFTREFENEYADNLFNTLEDLGNHQSISKELLAIPDKYSWIAPDFVPSGGICEIPYKNGICSHERKDFGDLPGTFLYLMLSVYIIDGENAQEVDDGISIERKYDGDWVHIHIADPTAYLSPNHPIALLAQMRHGSIYFPGNHISLIPQKLTAKVLNLGKSPFALTFSAKFNDDGDISDYMVKPSIIKNIQTISYSKVDQLIQNDSTETRAYKDLKLIKYLMDKHMEFRTSQGAINAYSNSEVVVDSYPLMSSFKSWNSPSINHPRILLDVKSDDISRTMVSECMIVAGRIGAQFFKANKIPGLYRGQEAPRLSDPKIMKIYQSLMEKRDPKSGILPLVEARKLISLVNPATLSTLPISHFSMGLDNKGYLKLSSPLRRYTDLLLHWNLKAYWSKTKYPFSEDDILSMVPSRTILERQIKTLVHYSNRYWILEWVRRRQVLINSHTEVVKDERAFIPHESEFGIPSTWRWNRNDDKKTSDNLRYTAIILEVDQDRKSLKICIPSLSNLTASCFYKRHDDGLVAGNSIDVSVFMIDPGVMELKLDYLPK